MHESPGGRGVKPHAHARPYHRFGCDRQGYHSSGKDTRTVSGMRSAKATLQVSGGQYDHTDEIGQHLRCDIVFVGGRKTKTPFHFVVEEKCGLRGIEKLKTQTAISLFEAPTKQVSFYRARGFSPEKLFYDDGANVTGAKYMSNSGLRVKTSRWRKSTRGCSTPT